MKLSLPIGHFEDGCSEGIIRIYFWFTSQWAISRRVFVRLRELSGFVIDGIIGSPSRFIFVWRVGEVSIFVIG